MTDKDKKWLIGQLQNKSCGNYDREWNRAIATKF